MSTRTTSAALASVALLLAAWFSVAVPSAALQNFGVIALGKSVVTLAPTTQLKSKMTAIGWQETPVGLDLTVYPQQDVIVRVGGSRGTDSMLVPAGTKSFVHITMDDESTLEAELVINPPPPGVEIRRELDVTTKGTFDPLSKVEPPYLDEYGHVDDDPSRLRHRLWVNYYGLHTAITVADG